MQVGMIGTLLPDTTHAREAQAAARALERAALALAPVGIPEDPPAPDVVGARAAFGDAIERLRAALVHTAGRPGERHVELALAEAEEALLHLRTPGIAPPIDDVVGHAARGTEFVEQALALFDHNPVGWVGPVGVA